MWKVENDKKINVL